MHIIELITTTLSVLLTFTRSESPPSFPDGLPKCTPALDGSTHCDPMCHAWSQYKCDGQSGIWKRGDTCDSCHWAIEEATKRDWHIGCTDNKCSYYNDGKTKLHRRTEDWDYFAMRCQPGGQDTIIERFEDGDWVDHYACPHAGSCRDLDQGHPSCQIYLGADQWVVPGRENLTTFKCNSPDDWSSCKIVGQGPLKPHSTIHARERMKYFPPTRCNPKTWDAVQYWDEWKQLWIDFYDCAPPKSCEDINGHGACDDGHTVVLPTTAFPTSPYATTTTIYHPSATSTSGDGPSSSPSAYNKLVSGDIQTRCDPDDKGVKLVQYLKGKQWSWFYSCRGKCVQFPYYAACHEATNRYLVPTPETLVARDVSTTANQQGSLHPRQAPDFHTYYTRCNPANLNEIIVLVNDKWVHFFTCPFKNSCSDLDGHGACHLQDNTWLVPAANDTSIRRGAPVSPFRIETRCNPKNESEVQEWNGKVWSYSGVCLPHYVCYDHDEKATFASCKHLDTKNENVWLPWPQLNSLAPSGIVTRCRGPSELTQFNGLQWVPYRQCRGAFTCQSVHESSGHRDGGCVAGNFKEVHADDALPFHDGPGAIMLLHQASEPQYEPFGFEHEPRLPKRTEKGLVENTDKLIYQGDHLIDEGNDLIHEGKLLHESLFGIGNKPTDHKSPSSSFHRRSQTGLVDDSIGMRLQGEHLVMEGTKLVEQGKDLLYAIFGEQSENVIKAMTGTDADSVAKIEIDTATSPTATKQARNVDDNNNSSDSEDESTPFTRRETQDLALAPCRLECDCGAATLEECGIECRKCILMEAGEWPPKDSEPW